MRAPPQHGHVTDRLGDIEASLVDAANASVFIDAAALGLTGKELPTELEERPQILERLAQIRAQGAAAIRPSGTPRRLTRRAPLQNIRSDFIGDPLHQPSGDEVRVDVHDGSGSDRGAARTMRWTR